jgi:LPXTG-motif cell wall-anchored protein
VSTKKALSSVVGVSAVLVALPVVASGTAYATKGGDRCERATVEYSLDDGKTWTTKSRMDEALVTKIKVRLKETRKNTCEYAVSLASYGTEGPTWQTSGKQTFLGWDTTKLNKEHPEATLDVSDHKPKCFGQVDLYGNGKKFDGVENPLPKYPNGVFPNDLITAWNGGQKCETPTTPPSSTPPSTSPSVSASASPSTSKPVPSTSAPTSGKPSGSATPSTAPSSSAPAPVPGDDTPPQGKPEVPPLTETAPASLAETGGDGNTGLMIGAAAGVLLVGGAGVLVWNRRRNNGATPA